MEIEGGESAVRGRPREVPFSSTTPTDDHKQRNHRVVSSWTVTSSSFNRVASLAEGMES